MIGDWFPSFCRQIRSRMMIIPGTCILAGWWCMAQPDPEPDLLKAWLDRRTGWLERKTGIQCGFFFDIPVTAGQESSNGIFFGEFELDLTREWGRYFQAAAAVVANPEDPVALATGFVDFHLFGGLIAPRGRIFVEKGFHLQLGRFDLPFGNDWIYYASIDRLTITAPLTTELVMDGGYSGDGFRLLGNSPALNYTVWLVRGNGRQPALGGRLGVTPFHNPYTLRHASESQMLECGLSCLYDIGPGGTLDEKAWALDLESTLGRNHLQLEYCRREYAGEGEEQPAGKRDGFQITESVHLDGWIPLPLTSFVRYDRQRTRPRDRAAAAGVASQILNRFSAGGRLDIRDWLTLKVEYQRFFKADPRYLEESELSPQALNFQLVVGF